MRFWRRTGGGAAGKGEGRTGFDDLSLSAEVKIFDLIW